MALAVLSSHSIRAVVPCAVFEVESFVLSFEICVPVLRLPVGLIQYSQACCCPNFLMAALVSPSILFPLWVRM